ESSPIQPAELQRTNFLEQRIELKGVGTQLRRSATEFRSDREMSVEQLQGVVDTARAELATIRSEGRRISEQGLQLVLAGPISANRELRDSPGYEMDARRISDARGIRAAAGSRRAVSSDDLAYRTAMEARRIANNAHTAQDRINQYRVEIHKKFAIPFACIIFVLIGAPLAVRFPRGGVGMVIAASLGIFGIYYVSLIGGERLADHGIIAPFWGPWAPNLLFGAIALWGLSRMGRETETSRGGGLEDYWIAIR